MGKKHLALACAAVLGTSGATASETALRQIDLREQRIALLNSEMEELSLKRQIQELRQQVDQSVIGHAPVLVGITTGRSGAVAEFVGQQGVQTAAAGEAIGAGWAVRAIGKNSVELVHLDNGTARRYEAVIGSAPVLVGAR